MAVQNDSKSKTHSDYAVGWVCALPKEQTAATAMLDQRHADLPKPPNDYNTYTLGSIASHNIVIACLPKGKIGSVSAAGVALQMANTFPSIKFGLMVGIGGGIPPKVRLGDVVVSTPVGQFPGVVQWDFGKVEDGGGFERTGALNNPPTSLLTALTKLETEHEFNKSQIFDYLDQLKVRWPRMASKYLRSESLEDVLFRPSYSHVSKLHPADNERSDGGDEESEDGEEQEEQEEQESCRFCDKTKVIKRKTRDMRIHYGLIASGNQIINDATFRDTLNKNLGGGVLCVEMEAAGLMSDFPCIVIRAAAFAKELLGYVQPSDVEGERPVKHVVDQILNTVSRTEAKIENVNSKLARLDHEIDFKVLNWLARDYGSQQSDYIKLQQPGTGQWLLESLEFQTWLDADNETLFCPGIPGAGKTIITAILVDRLHRQYKADINTGIAYLYCNFKRQNEQNVEDLLASLLRQLVQNLSSLPESIVAMYNEHNKKGTRPSLGEISETLVSIAAIYSRVFVLVDALDECQEAHRTRFLSEILNFQVKTRANYFATSRFIPDIEDCFREKPTLEIRAAEPDIRKYLKNHIQYIPGIVKDDLDLQMEVVNKIIEKVDGMFLLAKFRLDSLAGMASTKEVLKVLERNRKFSAVDGDAKSAYDDAYHDTMQRIQTQVLPSRQRAIKILSWITFANRPLTISELQHILAVEPDTQELDKLNLPRNDLMIGVCSGLVTVDEESRIVRLVHYTAQEYFERTWHTWLPEAQNSITETCVTYLSYDTFKTGLSTVYQDFETRLESNVLYDYAAQNWGHHARVSSIEGGKLILDLFKSESAISACSQTILLNMDKWQRSYSHPTPQKMAGLILAAYFGLAKSVAAMLSHSVDLEVKDSLYDRTPMSWAAGNGHEAVVKLLVDKGANLEAEDVCGDQTLLSWAAANGNEELVKLLVDKGADLEAEDVCGRTPLSRAANNGHVAVVMLLVEKGAVLETEDENGWTPLSEAAGNGHIAVVNLLIEKGAGLETTGEYGSTSLMVPLLKAAENGHEAVVKLLVEKSTDPEVNYDYKWVSILIAAKNGYVAIVKMLVDKGADLEAKDKYDQTPLLLAANNGHEAVVKLLVEKGADLEAEDECGRTSLFRAANNGHMAMVMLLIEKGADLEAEDECGQTPLSRAANNGHMAVGADLEAKNEYNWTPLLQAAENGHEAVVKMLVDKGADPQADDYYNWLLLLSAVENG
ncbi:Ankyrin-2 [Dactylellina cionopaga]|nr:Ankyrin-2 [Dactylellina cionopaga]